MDELGEFEGAVSILAWPGYVEDGSNDPEVDWVSAFEEETNCEVTSKTYGTSDEAFSLMKTGDYDVVAASGHRHLPGAGYALRPRAGRDRGGRARRGAARRAPGPRAPAEAEG